MMNECVWGKDVCASLAKSIGMDKFYIEKF